MSVKKNINSIFTIFLIAHLSIWTLIPSISNINLPLDTIEALAWSSDLSWGFNKHPPMSAFIVEIVYKIFGNQDWAFYFLSQIFVCFSFYVVWKFSKEFFKDDFKRLISVLLLEGIYFYNFTTPEFNVYICELPFWVLTVFFCWRGIKSNQTYNWLLFGVFAALGVLSHYLFLYLLTSLSFYLIYLLYKTKIGFNCISSLFAFMLFTIPHFIWLFENNFVTLGYGLKRTGFQEIDILNHFLHPTVLLIKQVGILIPFFLMCIIIVSKFKIHLNLNNKNTQFLIVINILPLFLIFLTSTILGVKIRTMWMTPFYLFSGIFFVYLFQQKIKQQKFSKFLKIFIFLFFISPSLYLYISISQDNKRTDYPGKEIARLVQNKWDNNFVNEIKLVVGDEWSAGNLSYHLNSRPIWKLTLTENLNKVGTNEGVIYTGNPEILEKICPGVFGTIRPVGYCMIGQK